MADSFEARNRQIRILFQYLTELQAAYSRVNPANQLALDVLAGDIGYTQSLLREANESLKMQFIVEPYTIETFTPENARAHALENLAWRDKVAKDLHGLLHKVHDNVHAPLAEKYAALRDNFQRAGQAIVAAGGATGSITITNGVEAIGSVALLFGTASFGRAAFLGTTKSAIAAQQPRVSAPDPRVSRYIDYLLRWYDHAATILLHNFKNRKAIRAPILFGQWLSNPI